MKRTSAAWPFASSPRRASDTAPTASIGFGSMISAISMPTCTAWPICTGTVSTMPSIGALTIERSASACAAASAARAAATADSSAARLLRGASPLSISFLFDSYSDVRWSSIALACATAAVRPSSEMLAMAWPALTRVPRLTERVMIVPEAWATAWALWSALVTHDSTTWRACCSGVAVVIATFWIGTTGVALTVGVRGVVSSACGAEAARRESKSAATTTSTTAISRLGLKIREAISSSPENDVGGVTGYR